MAKNRWAVSFSKDARKQLHKLPKPIQTRILNYLTGYISTAHNPRTFGKPLQGALKKYWRYRVGSYRILCKIIDGEITILVIDIGHRKDIYE